MSLSDGGIQTTMPVAPANNYGGGMGMWGQDWIWIIVLFLFGWGRNGFGGNSGAMDNYVLASDFATLQRQIDSATSSLERKGDSISNGLCDGFYQQAQLVNGTNMAMANGFAQAELSRSNQQAALMQQLNAMQMQAQQCCCDQRADTAQLRYDLATQGCETRNAIQTSTREIVTNANDNTRAILDFLVNSKMQDLQTENQNLKLAASQAAQNNYLVSQLRPTPIPAYQSCNPWAGGSYTGCCGC